MPSPIVPKNCQNLLLSASPTRIYFFSLAWNPLKTVPLGQYSSKCIVKHISEYVSQYFSDIRFLLHAQQRGIFIFGPFHNVCCGTWQPINFIDAPSTQFHQWLAFQVTQTLFPNFCDSDSLEQPTLGPVLLFLLAKLDAFWTLAPLPHHPVPLFFIFILFGTLFFSELSF
jgi:hypothetical protein